MISFNAVSVPQGALPANTIAKWNKDMQGVAYWIQSPTDSPFMTAETVVELYENLYAPAFKLQRHAHNLQLANRGMLICDGFTGCHADTSGVDDRRRRWADQNRTTFICPKRSLAAGAARGNPATSYSAFTKHVSK